jgi:hypothetical protein
MTNQDVIVTCYAVLMIILFFIVKIGVLYLLMSLFTPKE